MITFLEEANRIKDELITIRRDLHEHPELGFEEKRTSEKIKEFLRFLFIREIMIGLTYSVKNYFRI